MTHISSRNFTLGFDFEERFDLIRKYSGEEWELAKYRAFGSNGKISKNAVKIAEIIENKLGLELFPLVNKIACKGWDISGGTYAFSMYDKEGKEYYFDSRARYYTAKTGEYEIGDDNVIYRNI